MAKKKTPKASPAELAGSSVPLHAVAAQPSDLVFGPGDEFWAGIEKLAGSDGLIAAMDQAMEGHSAPRIWLILHEPGESEWGAGVAMAFANQLGARDQVALVLDCDDRSQALTTWAERKECEGWIDLARYGISLMAAGLPMPFSGRRGYFLGVGSFAPTDVTAAEIETVMNRLRRQADDLILVAPTDDIGRQWAAAAHIRLLCWHQGARPVAELSGLVASLAADGCSLTGLVGLGDGQPAEEQTVVVAPQKTSVASPSSEPTVAEEVPPVPQPEEELDQAEAEPKGTTPLASVEDNTKGTSGVFWLLASAAVVIVVIMGVYWFQYVRVPERDQLPPQPAVVQKPAPQEVAKASPGEVHTDTHLDGSRLEGNPMAGEMANGDDLVPEDTVATVTDSLVEVAQEDSSAIAATDLSTDEAASEPVEQPAEEPIFVMAPYESPVGEAGWALHLYSLADSAGADAEVAELHRRGFTSAVRIIEKAGSGRLWRVYVGSFANHTDARTGARLLKEELRIDWANPTRF